MSWRETLAVDLDDVRELAVFEGRRAYLRAARGSFIFFAVPGLPVVALVANAYLGHARFEQLLLGLLLIIATAAASAIWRQRRWERPVAGRLASWRAFDPSRGEV